MSPVHGVRLTLLLLVVVVVVEEGGYIVPFSQFVEGRVDTAQPHLMKVLRSSSLWYSLNDVTVTQELADVDWQATFVITAQHSFLRCDARKDPHLAQRTILSPPIYTHVGTLKGCHRISLGADSKQCSLSTSNLYCEDPA